MGRARGTTREKNKWYPVISKWFQDRQFQGSKQPVEVSTLYADLLKHHPSARECPEYLVDTYLMHTPTIHREIIDNQSVYYTQPKEL